MNEFQSFELGLSLPWNLKNITEVSFDDNKNEYCNLLKATYILSWIGGVSYKNLESDNNLASSFAKFYFFYHLNKFYNYPKLLDNYNTKPVEEHPWELYPWKDHKFSMGLLTWGLSKQAPKIQDGDEISDNKKTLEY